MTAGRGARIESYPNSVCRLPVTEPPSTVSSLTCEITGRRNRSATAAQSTAPPPSADCWPNSTRSAPSFSSAPASAPAVPRRSAPSSEESEMSTARSAPIARGLLQLQRLLDRVRVEVRDRELDRPVQPLRTRIEAPAGGRIGNCFHTYGDLHGARDSSRRARLGIAGTRGYGGPMRRLISIAVGALALACTSTSAAKSGVPALLFPVVGPVTYTNDFGQARPGGPH